MRKAHETLELALSLLDQNPCNREYMCCHLDWMDMQGYITIAESSDAQGVIRRSIGNCATLAQYLRETEAMPQQVAVLSVEFRHYQETFYRGLISKLQLLDAELNKE
jgi:hypothetical protein